MTAQQMHAVLVTADVVEGDGQGAVNLQIARELIARDHRLTVIADRIDDDLLGSPEVEWWPTRTTHLPTQLLRRLVFAGAASWRLRGLERDVTLACGFASFSSSDVNAVHFVHRSWWRSPHHPRHIERGLRSWYQACYTAANVLLEWWSLRRSDVIVAVSENVRRDLVEFVDGSKVTVIPNGVDCSRYRPGDRQRSFLPVPQDRIWVLFVGDSKSGRKNLDLILEALPSVHDAHLLVAGEHRGGPYVARAQEHGVADRVHFLGHRTDVPDLMRAADFVVYPSRYDPFGLVVLEAMASGIPVVTSRSVGASSLVGDAGIVLDDPDDGAALSAAMQRLASNSALRRCMGNTGRRRAEQQSFSIMGAHYADLLERVVSVRRQ